MIYPNNKYNKFVFKSQIKILQKLFFRYSIIDDPDIQRWATSSRPNGWFHMVMVIQGGAMTVYHNKIEQSLTASTEQNHPGSRINDYGDDFDYLAIGPRSLNRLREAGGQMDELAMWNRALSAEEVGQIYDTMSE